MIHPHLSSTNSWTLHHLLVELLPVNQLFTVIWESLSISLRSTWHSCLQLLVYNIFSFSDIILIVKDVKCLYGTYINAWTNCFKNCFYSGCSPCSQRIDLIRRMLFAHTKVSSFNVMMSVTLNLYAFVPKFKAFRKLKTTLATFNQILENRQ